MIHDELAELIETAGDELANHETILDEARDILNEHAVEDNDEEADEDAVERVMDRLRDALFDVQRAADEVHSLLYTEESDELADSVTELASAIAEAGDIKTEAEELVEQAAAA